MKAVILAAGRGTRISSVSKGLPKCLLRFGDDAILDFQLAALLKAGVREVALVVGYEKDMIIGHVVRRYADLWDRIHFVVNPRFAETNNSYSLLLARPWVGDSDFICMNADVLCHPDIVLPAVRTTAEVSMVIDPEWRDETMKVIIVNGHIVRMSKAITHEEYSGTYLGFTTFSRDVCNLLFRELDNLIREGHAREFFNAAVERMIPKGVPVDFTYTLGLPWAEIDDPADLHFALTKVHPDIPAPECRPETVRNRVRGPVAA